MPTFNALLKTYIFARDQNRADLLSDICTENAVLTFAIRTDEHVLGEPIVNDDGGKRLLTSSIGGRYVDCRTFCAGDPLDASGRPVSKMPWLMLMRHAETGCMRIGTGYFDWRLAQRGKDDWLIEALHIQVERMDAVDIVASQALIRLQALLPYPLAPRQVMHAALETVAAGNPAFAFLTAYMPQLRCAHPEVVGFTSAAIGS